MKIVKEIDDLGAVDGLAVVKDEALMSGLQRPMKYRKLTLQNGTTVIGCGECPKATDFTGTRGEVQIHRIDKHGMKGGSIKQRKPSDELPPALNDAADDPEDGDSTEDDGELVAASAVEIPPAVGAMTIAEVFRLGSDLQRLGDLVVELRAENREIYRDLSRQLKEERAARSDAEGKLQVITQTFVKLGMNIAVTVDA